MSTGIIIFRFLVVDFALIERNKLWWGGVWLDLSKAATSGV